MAIPDDDNCPACMDVPLYPVKLPCGHAYCFLCLKGEFLQRHGDAAEDEKVECGVCQTELLETLLEEPKQLKRTKSDLSDIGCGDMCWFYKDGADWWKYDKK